MIQSISQVFRVRNIVALLVIVLVACAAPSPTPTIEQNQTMITSIPEPIPPTISVSPTEEAAQEPSFTEVARLSMGGGFLEGTLSPDGTRLAIIAWDGLYLLDTFTLETIWWYPARVFIRDRAVIWLGDDRILFAAGPSSQVMLNAIDGTIVEDSNYERHVGSSSFSPNGKYAADYDVVYDLHSGETLLNLPVDTRGFELFWLPDGEHFLFFDYGDPFSDDPITLWSVQTGEVIKEYDSLYFSDYYRTAKFLNQNQFLYISKMYFDDEIPCTVCTGEILDLETSQHTELRFLEGEPSDHGWVFDEETILLGNGYFMRMNGPIPEVTQFGVLGQYVEIEDGFLVMLPDMVLHYNDQFEVMAQSAVHDDARSGYTEPSLSPDGKFLAIGGYSHYSVWDIESGELQPIFRDPVGLRGGVSDWSPSGDRLAIGTHIRGEIHLWDVESRRTTDIIQMEYHICNLEWVDDRVVALVLSDVPAPPRHYPCSLGATIPSNHYLRLIDTQTGDVLFSELLTLDIFDMHRSPDGRYLAFDEVNFSREEEKINKLRVWDTDTYQTVFVVDPVDAFDLQWMPDSSAVLVRDYAENDEGSILRVFDLETQEEQTMMLDPDLKWYGSLVPIADQYVLLNTLHEQIIWLSSEGETTVLGAEMWKTASEIIVDEEGRIFVVVGASIIWNELYILFELFAPG